MRCLVTGGCGFIGHHFVEHLIKNTDWEVVVFDKLSYASNGYDKLRDIDCFNDQRIKIFSVDTANAISPGVIQEVGLVDVIVHMAAETHVDRSIADPKPFIMSNVLGTYNMLEYARMLPGLQKFIYFSTDEVFGPAPDGIYFKEWAVYNSTNPYAATKAGGEELCLAYANTYKVPVIATHTMNVFGERQHPEKFIPMTVRKILSGDTVQIHSGKTRTIPGSRCWIHARNVANGIEFLINHAVSARDKFNIVGQEVDNLTLAELIADMIGKELKCELVDFHSSRPGHDLRYALDGSKMKEFGWKAPRDFENSLARTIKWMIDHPKWLEVKDGLHVCESTV